MNLGMGRNLKGNLQEMDGCSRFAKAYLGQNDGAEPLDRLRYFG